MLVLSDGFQLFNKEIDSCEPAIKTIMTDSGQNIEKMISFLVSLAQIIKHPKQKHSCNGTHDSKDNGNELNSVFEFSGVVVSKLFKNAILNIDDVGIDIYRQEISKLKTILILKPSGIQVGQ